MVAYQLFENMEKPHFECLHLKYELLLNFSERFFENLDCQTGADYSRRGYVCQFIYANICLHK